MTWAGANRINKTPATRLQGRGDPCDDVRQNRPTGQAIGRLAPARAARTVAEGHDGWHNKGPAILLGPTGRYRAPQAPNAPAWWHTKSATPERCRAPDSDAGAPLSRVDVLQCGNRFSKSDARPQCPSGKSTIERARWRPPWSPQPPWSTAATQLALPRAAPHFHGPARPTASRQASLPPCGGALTHRFHAARINSSTP